jgi:hypothetical protein
MGNSSATRCSRLADGKLGHGSRAFNGDYVGIAKPFQRRPNQTAGERAVAENNLNRLFMVQPERGWNQVKIVRQERRSGEENQHPHFHRRVSDPWGGL